MKYVIAAIAFSVGASASARAADVDWKMYGTASIDGGAVCFYEGKSVIAQSASTLRVWVKCLLQKDLDSMDPNSELGEKIVGSSVQKVREGYIPPFALVEDIDFDQALGVIHAEETANLSNIQPRAQVLYELNCSERMMRRLSTHVWKNGKESSDDKPSGWEYVPPEGSGTRLLLKILCRSQQR